MFLSADHTTAFQHALKIAARGKHSHGRAPGVEKRFAEVVQLDGLGIDLQETQVTGEHKVKETAAFHHVFKPEETTPFSVF